MAAYLTGAQAATRLARYGITYTPADGDLDVSSSELDSMGPWTSRKKDSAQERAFPRSLNLDGTDNTAGTIPEDILNATSLLAYMIGRDEGPAVTSMSVMDRSETYATPKTSQSASRILALIKPYQRRVGARAGGRYISDTEIFERY